MGRSASVYKRTRLLRVEQCNAILAFLYDDREGLPVGALRDSEGRPDPTRQVRGVRGLQGHCTACPRPVEQYQDRNTPETAAGEWANEG